MVASLYRYWYDTGYLHANPAAGLSAGSRARRVRADAADSAGSAGRVRCVARTRRGNSRTNLPTTG